MKLKSNKPNLSTALKSVPTITKQIQKGQWDLLKYNLKNGLLNRFKFPYPIEKMNSFFDKLPDTNSIGPQYLDIKEKIAIMTFDDIYDEEICQYEDSIDACSTFFLLSYELSKKINNINRDLQLHFDKRYSTLPKQKRIVSKLTNSNITINRNHTLWWDYSHFDLLYLALNGIKADSTQSGIKPYRLCVQGKLLPIWEIPYSVCDSSNILSATLNISNSTELLFKKGVTPIVGLFHPQNKNKSNWKDFYKYAKKYNYNLMTMSDFYNKYLKGN
tara:strand:- start:1188 stop:2006 length:819 start_codon:yes stop_codon:yes gene_type:complete